MQYQEQYLHAHSYGGVHKFKCSSIINLVFTPKKSLPQMDFCPIVDYYSIFFIIDKSSL